MYGNCKTVRGEAHFYYVCSNSWRKHSCTARHIPAEELETQIIELLQSRIYSSEFLQKVSQQLQNDSQRNQQLTQKQRESAAKRLQAVNFRIKNLMNLLSEGIEFEEVSETLTKLKQEKEVLTATLDTLDHLPPTIREESETVPQRLTRLSLLQPSEQAALLRQYVDKVFVFAEKKSKTPATVEILLRSDLFPDK